VNLTWKRTRRDLDDARVKPMYKSKRTLRRELDEARLEREDAKLNYQDTLRQLKQETQIAQDAIRERDAARANYETARLNCWDWEESYNTVTAERDEARKARDEAVALAGEYAKVLEDTYGYTPPLTPSAGQQVEDLPAVFLELATEHKAEHPEVEGKTTSFYRLTPEQEAELRKDLPDVAAWDAFTTSVPTVPVRKRRRVPAARKPAGGS